jgi:hypothetical protein
MTPYEFYYDGAMTSYVGGAGIATATKVNSTTESGFRPVVSLKLGTEFDTGGDGTGTNPYVVKY